MEDISQFIREKSGKLSAVRGCLITCVLTACYVSVVSVHSDRSLVDIAGLVGVLLGVPFVNKVWQKDKE